MSDADAPRCLLSHPALTHHNLSIRLNPAIRSRCFTCGGKHTLRRQDYVKYYCKTCGVEFHKGCHKRPRRITHPYHLQHPLTLFYRDPESGTVSNIIPDANPDEVDISYEEYELYELEYETSGQVYKTSVQGKFEFVDIVPSKSDIIFDKCTWCGKGFEGNWFYRCLICSFCLDLPCAEKVPPLTVANPKGHHHSLIFLPRPLLVPCDACGFVNALEPSYACFQCNYMVHQSCIDLPRVIKITRHPHRLHYIPYRSPLSSLCRICYKDVDVKYGQYSCNQEDCSYVVHSRCATHVNVWDGTDLEWEPEDSDETDQEDIAPFKNLGDGIIDHFSHKHLLKLKKHNGFGDKEKQCEACVYHIVSHQFYDCDECNYSLHEVCAGLPRKLDHALHNHTLILDTSPIDDYVYLACKVCFRASTGFRYRCHKEGCGYFSADVRCISVEDCFIHKSHEHHFFISTAYNSKDEIICKGCKKRFTGSHLQCTVCEYYLCYPCGTLPDEIYYKYDKHPLTLSYGENISADDKYWCEMCEKLLDPKECFYTCNECCTTFHLHCIFGSSFFMKPGSKFSCGGRSVEVMRNSSNTRLPCYICKSLCTASIYYEGYRSGYLFSYNNGFTYRIPFCSLYCLTVKTR